MIESIGQFFERYGWYALFGAFAFFLIYQKFLHDKIQNLYENRELVKQKKFDESQQQANQERMEKARLKMQEEYSKQVQRELEIKEEQAQKRKIQKLGLSEEELKANANKPARFDGLQFVKDQIASKPVVIFSKSWCPYSRKAKQVLIGSYRIDSHFYTVIELDEIENGELIQDALQRVTGGRSVPRVFIQGEFIGGGDDTERLHRENKLSPMLKAANVKFVE